MGFPTRVIRIAIDPTNPDELYVGLEVGGLVSGQAMPISVDLRRQEVLLQPSRDMAFQEIALLLEPGV